MPKQVRRGYIVTDSKQFSDDSLLILQKAAEEIYFLLNRGYSVKSATTFVGNHHLLSERQRVALARVVSSEANIKQRQKKKLTDKAVKGKTLYIDGLNTVITLETAYSDSMLLKCMDGTVRDLAELRGTYRLIDKTDYAIRALADTLEELQIAKAVFYLDAPVSNSGRLKKRILNMTEGRNFATEVWLENGVDALLKGKKCVVTADAIILDDCQSWYPLVNAVIQKQIGNYKYINIYHGRREI